jgi:hypothetical protein
MAAANLDILIEQGANFKRTLKFTDNQLVPVPIDLTGYIYEAKLRKTIDAATSILNFTCIVLNQITNPGEMTMELTAVQTSSIPVKAQKVQIRTVEPFAYDLEVTYPSGFKERILQGVANVSPEVTR